MALSRRSQPQSRRPAGRRRRDCHSAEPPSTLSRCFHSDGERASAEWQCRRRLPRLSRRCPPRRRGQRGGPPARPLGAAGSPRQLHVVDKEEDEAGEEAGDKEEGEDEEEDEERVLQQLNTFPMLLF